MIFKDSKVAVIDGVRTPFMKAPTGKAQDLKAYDLARHALNQLKHRYDFLENDTDQITLGSVTHNAATSNIARESMIGAGYNLDTPAYTVTMACISANVAITNAAQSIQLGAAKVAVAGGVESSSDAPVRISDAFKKTLLTAQKAKGLGGFWKVFKQFKFKSLVPVAPAIAEFSTGLSMGQDADQLAAKFGVTREMQDEFALNSHHKAAKAWEDGKFETEVVALPIKPKFEVVEQDDTFYANSSMEKLSTLRPAFVRPHGTITAGNASPITDGAAVSLLMDIDEAKARKLKPKVVIEGFTFSGSNPQGELLLGPAYTLTKLLNEAGLKIEDIDVFEIHEAFAGQVLANLAAIQDEDFCKKSLGLDGAFGEIPMDKINTQGGSLSLGHPFGATGSRLLTSATRRLIETKGKYALISACAAGGLGSSILLKRVG
ncbi:acetyl-CoA C-acyltransferase [Marinicella rhabdoformis]|uniref:acetyl-CoA C-acyltransferase n=1 Tax=Marinicella rhabdoformis TaxID=2580566 RepID=UPI0012AEB4A2|nr:acetyl-CoA C-acyltransferase [Marinicella rhabdoformis]